MLPANPFGSCNKYNAVFYADINRITYIKLCISEHILCKTKSLAISPFLYFCKHSAPPYVYPMYSLLWCIFQV